MGRFKTKGVTAKFYWAAWWDRVWSALDKRVQIVTGLLALGVAAALILGASLNNGFLTVASAVVIVAFILFHLVFDTAEIWQEQEDKNSTLRDLLEVDSSLDPSHFQFRLAMLDLSGLNADRSTNERVSLTYEILNYSGWQLELAGATLNGAMLVGNDYEVAAPAIVGQPPIGDRQKRPIKIEQPTPDLRRLLFERGMGGNGLFVFDTSAWTLRCRAVKPGLAPREAMIPLKGDTHFAVRGPLQADVDFVGMNRENIVFGSPRWYDADGKLATQSLPPQPVAPQSNRIPVDENLVILFREYGVPAYNGALTILKAALQECVYLARTGENRWAGLAAGVYKRYRLDDVEGAIDAVERTISQDDLDQLRIALKDFVEKYDELSANARNFLILGLHVDKAWLADWTAVNASFDKELDKLSKGVNREWLKTLGANTSKEGRELLIEQAQADSS